MLFQVVPAVVEVFAAVVGSALAGFQVVAAAVAAAAAVVELLLPAVAIASLVSTAALIDPYLLSLSWIKQRCNQFAL